MPKESKKRLNKCVGERQDTIWRRIRMGQGNYYASSQELIEGKGQKEHGELM